MTPAPNGKAVPALLRVAVLAAALLPRPGSAQAGADAGLGNSQPCDGIPNCQLQQQAPVTYKSSTSNGWAYYCTGDHPYYWGKAWAGNSGRWVQTNSCFTTDENGLAEGGDPGKLDVTVHNWCTSPQDYVISLACSNVPPPAWAENCAAGTSQNVDHDPGCPHVPNTDKTISRSVGGVPIFFFLWVEQCAASNLFWNCSADQGLVQCSSCPAKTN